MVKPLDPEPSKPTKSKRRRLRGRALARGVVQVVLTMAVLFGAYTALQIMIANKPQVKQRPARERVYIITATPVEIGAHRPTLAVYGEVTASRTADLRVLVSGQVVNIHPDLKVGAVIEAGERLVEIDRFSYQGAVTEAKASLAEAHAKLTESEARKALEKDALKRAEEQLAIAQRDLTRTEQLMASGNMAESNIDERRLILSQRGQAVEQRRNNLIIEEARTTQLATAVERQAWRLQQAERNLADTVLKAPFTGVVTAENVEKGRLLNASDLAVRMYDRDRLEVRFTLSDQQFGRLITDADPVIGRPVAVVWHVGDVPVRFEAEIDRTGAEIAAARGGVELYARLIDPDARTKLRPGAFVELNVPGSTIDKAIRLPETAVYTSEGGSFVYVVVSQRLEARAVKVKAYEDGDVIVLGPLKESERVLTTRIAEVGEGLKVREERENGGPGAGPGLAGAGKPLQGRTDGRGS